MRLNVATVERIEIADQGQKARVTLKLASGKAATLDLPFAEADLLSVHLSRLSNVAIDQAEAAGNILASGEIEPVVLVTDFRVPVSFDGSTLQLQLQGPRPSNGRVGIFPAQMDVPTAEKLSERLRDAAAEARQRQRPS